MTQETTPEQNGVLTQKDLYDDRMRFGTEGIKSLLLINGGGAVALLAFLQQVWSKHPELIVPVLFALTFLTLGLALTAPMNFVRIESNEALAQKNKARLKRMSRIHRRLVSGSIACFVIAMIIMVIGAWLNLPKGEG